MKSKKIGITVVFFLAAAMTAGCGNSKEQAIGASGEELRGRDFVRIGTPATVTGTLKPERGEWFLVSGDDVYEIHLGDHAHRERTGIRLTEGSTATVTGFMYRQENADEIDIAVVTVTIDGTEYRFREDDGTPLWRGQSRGSGDGARDAEGINRGGGHRR